MSVTEMTVVEFAAKHCAEHEQPTQDVLTAHVNAIILAAMTRNRALWTVGIDPEGRASLIWISLPEHVWDMLLHEGVQAFTLMRLLGDGS